MSNFFMRRPYRAKLLLIGIIPLLFLVYISFQLYSDKTQKVSLLKAYIGKINQSSFINTIIDHLQRERKFSFDYAMRNERPAELDAERQRTDSVIKQLEQKHDMALQDFRSYTFLNELQNVRNHIDSSITSPDQVMHYYSTMIYRLNTLHTVSPGNEVYLQPVHQDLVAHKLLSENISSLRIICANIYNVLYTKKYMVETLIGLKGVYDIYKTYETEFLIKASPKLIEEYKITRSKTSLKPTVEYIDSLFKGLAFNNSYQVETWWRLSNEGVEELVTLQQKLWSNIQTRMNGILKNEQSSRDLTLFLLILALVFVTGLVFNTIHIISRSITNQKIFLEQLERKVKERTYDLNQANADLERSNKDLEQFAYVGKRLEQRFKALLDAAPDATVIVNEKGIIEMTNYQTENLFGYTREEMIGKPIEILIPEELRSKHEHHRGVFVKAARVRTMGEGLELNAVKKDGTRFPVEISLSPIKTEEGMLVSASVRDISLRKNLENELKRTNAEIEAFTYSVSHDLRAPLRGIIGFTTILEEEYSSKLDDEAKRITAVIKKNTLKMGHLIDDLLNFSRMGRQDIVKTSIDTRLMINEVIEELTPKNKIPKIEWVIKSLPTINADINTIHQVWVNLISNAIKYSGNEGSPHIEIGSFNHEGQTAFFVKDNGVGFDDRYKDKLFKVFQRLHSTKEFEGTGVGLALVEKIVSKHGGKVWAKGEVDKGASFYFSLPFFHKEGEAKKAEPII